MIDWTQNQGEEAWGNWLQQFRGKVRTEALVKSLFGPVDRLFGTYHDLLTKRGLDSAEGVQLDGIGQIVGISRDVPQALFLAYFGFKTQPAGRGFGQARMRYARDPVATSYKAPDAEYRRLIKAKIALNNSYGTTPDIIEAAKHVFRSPAAYLTNLGNANAQLWIGRIPSPNEPPYSFYEQLLPRAAGVNLTPVWFDSANAFGFKNQGLKGFGVGILTRTSPSNLFPV